MVAVAIIGAAVVGGAATAIGSSSAARAQTNAANQANDRLNAQYAQTRSDLMPYQQAGQGGLNELQSRMGELTSPFNMTQQNLEATPGYQFNLSQGQKSVNNALGARGLLNSGAVMKGASSFATGLANSTYMDQFNMDQQNKQNAYNKLLGVSQLGENAAAQTGAFGSQIAGQVANNTIGIGNAQAAGAMGVANGIGSIGNNIAGYYNFKNYLAARSGQTNAGIWGYSQASSNASQFGLPGYGAQNHTYG
jgi:hypothetical protein